MEDNYVYVSQGRGKAEDMVMEEKLKGVKEAEAAFQRSKVYRLLSYSFFYPDDELLDFIKGSEFIKEISSAFEGHPVNTEWRVAVSHFKNGVAAIGNDIAMDEYMRLLTMKSKCPPYENEYYRGRGGGICSTEEMADIAGFYRAFGMVFSEERSDHIAVELEFMHLVTIKEAEAALKVDVENIDLCVSVEGKFLHDHLGRWADAFWAALTKEKSLFYTHIASLLVLWINLECQYLNVAPKKIEDFNMEDIEEEKICLGEVIHEAVQ
ncbi:MAG: Chaperone protein TorD [Syntrophomonadaceae bacterium]|nr:Chaperone protein TorD [Bacillota bacterium]